MTAGIWLVLALVLIDASTAILDLAAVNVAIHVHLEHLHASSGVVELVISAYMIV